MQLRGTLPSERRMLLRAVGLLCLLLCASTGAWAQLRIVGAVSGTVQDPTGAVVPNASVTLKDEQTGIARTTTSTEKGTFLFPDLATGSYEITVTVQGFQTYVLPKIVVSTSHTTDVKVSLTVGATSDTVTVTGGAEQLLETSSQLVSNTLTTQTVAQLPVANRSNVLALARLAPGASPPTGGSTRYNNLAGGAVNVTVDGINNASNGFKSGGTVFFATVPVRLGAVEEVSVETGGLGADSGAQSGANIKFTTRRGGKEYHGSGFYELRSEQFNANTWTRNAQGLPRVYNRNHEYGGNFGGPLVPFWGLKDKLFFFANYERVYNPQFSAQTVAIPTADAQRGLYTYIVSGTTNQTRTVNVLDLAAARGLRTTLDPVAQAILRINNDIPKYSRQIADTDLNRDTYTFNSDNNLNAQFPATRVDYMLTSKQQLTFTWNYRHSFQPGARRLPNPDIERTGPFRLGYFVYSGALQSTFTSNTFNEFRYGVQHSGDTNTRDEYGPYYTFNSKPLRIGATLPFGPLVPFIDQQNVTGRHFITTIYDTLTMNRGQHTYTFGGSYRNTVWNDVAVVYQVPTYGTGTPAGDPLQVANAYTTTTMPGIVNTELGNPLALYNLLTGRVATSNFTRVVNPDTFKYDGIQEQNYTWTNSKMGGLYAQDRWRISRGLTLNYGLRWEVQGPMKDGKGLTASPDLASIYGPSTRLFAPGQLSGNNNPTLEAGRVPFKTDWKNFAPNFGFAWQPNISEGWLGKLLGGDKTVLRGSYSVIVYDEGTQFFAANLGGNAGKTIGATQLIAGQAGATNLPAFYTLNDVVNNPLTVNNFAFSTTEYKKTINQADQTFVRTIAGFDPNLRAPYTQNYTFGIQRELWKNNVLEVRYVGNQSRLAWRTSNLNEVNIFENGFLTEFKNAQKNLQLNQAAGVQSFQNRNLAGQVALPIFDAAFGARGGLAAIAAASGYTSTAFITNLQNGEAGALANTLATNQNYVCRMFGSNFSPCARVLPTANVAGPYPINFFLLNPFVAGRLPFIDNGGWHNYNGLQVQFRQRLGQSLNWSTNYTFSKSLTNLAVDNQNQSLDYLTLRDPGLNRRASQFDLRHVIQTFGAWELPIGRGKWLATGNKLVDNLIGGWTLGNIFVFNTGAPIQLTGGFNTVNNTNNGAQNGVRLAPGVTLEQIQKLFNAERTRLTGRAGITDLQRLAVDASLIGADGRANPAFLLPNTTPGEFGQLLFLRDRNTFQWDASMTKAFTITEKTRFELFAGFNNLLNTPRWGFPDTNVFSTTFGVVGAPANSRTINLRGTLSF
ncbi:MAG TPA: carboxypeptidase regulatory-like domain-containing protein [Blastocatellia bacterium]|nr:carboxypeptidase regulatory-like domain-containing protein [Blastocatellia bacterium]